MTISFNKANSTSLSHNNRENLFGNPDIDLDRVKDNLTYAKSDIRELYHEVFGQAVAGYNAKQKRSDRKIGDYYSKILHDNKTHQQQELIVAVGGRDENTEEIFEMKKNILDEYMKGFQKRNPNLKVYNAVMHLDEANPHLHINFVPVYESKRGLRKRVGFDKAIEQQDGLTFESWRERETGMIETQLNKNGIERCFKGSHDYMKVSEYKEYAESLDTLKSLKNEFEGYLEESRTELLDVNEELELKKKNLEGANEKVEQLGRIERGIVEELAFNQKLKEFGYLHQSELKESDIKKIPMVGEVIKVETYRSLEKKYGVVLEQNKKLKMASEFNPAYQNELRQKLETENKNLKQSLKLKNRVNEDLTERLNRLSKENKTLKVEISELKGKFERFKSNVSAFLTEHHLLKDFMYYLERLNTKLKKEPTQTKRTVEKRQDREMER